MDSKRIDPGPLAQWFLAQARKLPWREAYEPYHVWISEIMLQQTRMEQGLPYFTRWIKALPDLRSLAQVEEGELLKLWEGLGYYSRAKNLKKAAQLILEKHQGELPQDKEALLGLPGVGPYTAGAILAIAFNQPEPLLDGNIERVLSRVLDWAEPVKSKATRQRFEAELRQLFSQGEPRILAQALMELGALVCRPQNPLCPECPLSPSCLAKTDGRWSQRPVSAPRPKTIRENRCFWVYRHEDRYYLENQPQGGHWAGMWLFPMELIATDASAPVSPVLGKAQLLTQFSYSITKYQVRGQAWLVQLENRPDWPGAWMDLGELKQIGLPRPAVLIRNALSAQGA